MSALLPAGSPLLRVGFVGLALFLAALFAFAVNRAWTRDGAPRDVVTRSTTLAAAAAFGWLALTAGAAVLGWLHFTNPPTMPLLIGTGFALAIAIGLSGVGKRLAGQLPLAALVGFQSFRIVVELLLHRAYLDGLMPIQMSYSGRNFDIVTGITAIPLALWLVRDGRPVRLVFLWNVMGLALLVNIMAVAMLSAPTPFRFFMNSPANVWVIFAPWVWLPTVMVMSALLGHLLTFRALAMRRTP